MEARSSSTRDLCLLSGVTSIRVLLREFALTCHQEIALVGFHDRAQVTDSPFPVPNCSEDRSESGYNLQVQLGHRIRHAA